MRQVIGEGCGVFLLKRKKLFNSETYTSYLIRYNFQGIYQRTQIILGKITKGKQVAKST